MNALILVDIQNDFLPAGALAVPKGDAVIAAANHPGRNVFETIDLHRLPQTHGTEFAPTLATQARSGVNL